MYSVRFGVNRTVSFRRPLVPFSRSGRHASGTSGDERTIDRQTTGVRDRPVIAVSSVQSGRWHSDPLTPTASIGDARSAVPVVPVGHSYPRGTTASELGQPYVSVLNEFSKYIVIQLYIRTAIDRCPVDADSTRFSSFSPPRCRSHPTRSVEGVSRVSAPTDRTCLNRLRPPSAPTSTRTAEPSAGVSPAAVSGASAAPCGSVRRSRARARRRQPEGVEPRGTGRALPRRPGRRRRLTRTDSGFPPRRANRPSAIGEAAGDLRRWTAQCRP